jgi:hypothetical protein
VITSTRVKVRDVLLRGIEETTCTFLHAPGRAFIEKTIINTYIKFVQGTPSKSLMYPSHSGKGACVWSVVQSEAKQYLNFIQELP